MKVKRLAKGKTMFGQKMFKFVVVCENEKRYEALWKAAVGALFFDKKSDFDVLTNGQIHIFEFSVPLRGKAKGRFERILLQNGYKLIPLYKIGCLYGLAEA